ncbi:MAG: VWA domain-containing protein [Planctomycetaceae bacterium]|nr:VWA domain-containing protein [Planctomycetaceae bacterium]
MHRLPIIAFNFATPALLWGLALASAPIIIHLLNRRKFRETQWAAMRFLLAAVRKNSRRMRIEQLILLAVRTLLLLLFVLALAQPLVEQLSAFFQPARPTHRIIVIDASLSMGYQARDAALFDRARETARGIVDAARQGDAFNLVRLSNLPPAVIVPTPAYQTAKVIEEIEQMQLPHGRGNLLACLEKTEGLLKTAPDLPQKEIYVISDFQRATWTTDSPDDATRLKGILRRLGEAGRLVLIDLGQPEAANMAVTSLENVDSLVTTTRPTRFRAALHNYGLERVTGRVVELRVDEKLVEQRAVEVNAGAEIIEDFSYSFTSGGEHRVEVRLQADRLPLDDQRWLAVPVRERLRVLCVNGRGGSSAAGRASDFIELALSPFTDSNGPARVPLRGQIEPVVVNEGELQSLDLSQYDCVIFCDVRLFTDREARSIETYVRAGGGVVWCLGDQVSAENYNQTLFRDGAGVLPARLGDRRGDPEKRDESFGFDPGEFLHPIVNAFQGNPAAGLETTQTYAYLQTVLPARSRAKVALRFDSGDPAIIEAQVGAGRSVLIATSADERWGLWPLWPSFLPMVHEIVQFAVAGRTGERQQLVGEPLSAVFAAPAIDVDVSVMRPDGQAEPVRITPVDALSQFSFDGTVTSGIYEVHFGHPLSRTELYAVNCDPKESNLVKLVEEELAQELLPGVEHEYETSWQERSDAAPLTPAAHRGGLTRWLLYAVLYLLFVEQLLAWDFRKGLWLLCPPVLVFDLMTRMRRAA